MMISFFSGFLYFTTMPNFEYMKTHLNIDSSSYTAFDSITKSLFILKPIFGYMSDVFHPRGYK